MAAAHVRMQYYITYIFWKSYKNSLTILKQRFYIQNKSFKCVPKSRPCFSSTHSTISHTHTLNPLPYPETPYKWPAPSKKRANRWHRSFCPCCGEFQAQKLHKIKVCVCVSEWQRDHTSHVKLDLLACTKEKVKFIKMRITNQKHRLKP